MDPIPPYLARLPPTEQESLAALLGISGTSDKVNSLQKQIDQAHALRGLPKRHYSTWGGALAGGLGDALGDVADTRHMDQLRTQQAPLQEQVAQGRQDYGRQYLAHQQEVERQQQAALRGQQQPMAPFGLGGGY